MPRRGRRAISPAVSQRELNRDENNQKQIEVDQSILQRALETDSIHEQRLGNDRNKGDRANVAVIFEQIGFEKHPSPSQECLNEDEHNRQGRDELERLYQLRTCHENASSHENQRVGSCFAPRNSLARTADRPPDATLT